jgi:acetyltransferase-like isoleucine patch superfamily enzyme
MSASAKISIGNNLIINSSKYSNLAGLYKNTTMVVCSDAELSIGNNCGFSGISIYATKSIKIGDNVKIGVNCMIWDSDFHQINAYDRANNVVQNIISREIRIGNNVWIAGNVIILKGTQIGDNSVIAAGSVVSGRIPKNQVWGGNPARFIYSISNIN